MIADLSKGEGAHVTRIGTVIDPRPALRVMRRQVVPEKRKGTSRYAKALFITCIRSEAVRSSK
jgi:hypothetical protein